MFQFFSKKGVPEKSARSSATPSASTADSSPSRTPSTAATVASIPISSLLGTLAFPGGVGCGSIPVLSMCDATVAAESVGAASSADASSALPVDTHDMSSPCASSSVSSSASVATDLPSSATEPLAACSNTVCSALDTSVSAAAEVALSEALPETAPCSLAKTTLDEAPPHVLQEPASNSTDVATSTSTASEPTAVPVGDEAPSTTAASTASATAKETKLSKKPDRGMISSLPKILGSKTKEEFETENKRMREDLSSLRKKLVESQETCAQLKEAVATVKRILASGTTWSNDQPASITPTAVQSVFCYLENFDVSASFSRNLGRGSVRQKRADESSGGSAGDKERKGGRRAAGVGDRRDAGGRRRGGPEATGGTREGKLRAVYRMRQNPDLGDDAGESGNERIGDSAARKAANRANGRKGSSDKKSKRGQWTEANSSSANGGTAKGSRYSYVVKSPTAEQQDKTLAVKELLREAGTVEDMEIAIRKAQEAEMNFEVQLALKKLVKIKKDLATVH